jgi:protein-disulfide isomerase
MAAAHDRLRLVLDTVGTAALVVTAAVVVWTTTASNRIPAASAGALAAPPSLVDSVDMTLTAGGHVRGAAGAKVAIVEFSDFQCPYCGRFAKETLPQIKRDFIDAGVAQFIYRDNPLESIHPFALKASAAAACAERQGKYWEMHDALFSQQRELAEASFSDHAKALHLDAATFSKCLDGGAVSGIKADQKEAVRLGIQSTPIFLIGRVDSKGTIKVTKRINGAAPYETFKAALKELL